MPSWHHQKATARVPLTRGLSDGNQAPRSGRPLLITTCCGTIILGYYNSIDNAQRELENAHTAAQRLTPNLKNDGPIYSLSWRPRSRATHAASRLAGGLDTLESQGRGVKTPVHV